ncbi:hypothetical protein SprV_0401667900 [Sparganum proliferum]
MRHQRDVYLSQTPRRRPPSSPPIPRLLPRCHHPPVPTSASTAAVSITTTFSDTPPADGKTSYVSSTPNITNIPTSSDVGSVYTCPRCDRTFTTHIGLVGHLRIYRTETGKPVPGAPTCTRRIRLHCPHCTAHSLTAWAH